MSAPLFWSVIAVSARQLKSEVVILSQLAPDLNQLLWSTLATSPLSLDLIQAMLLLSSWPLPIFRLWTDKSWILSNMAMNSAVQLGMHRPGCEIGYSKERVSMSQADISERYRTWIGSVTLCQR